MCYFLKLNIFIRRWKEYFLFLQWQFILAIYFRTNYIFIHYEIITMYILILTIIYYNDFFNNCEYGQ